MTPQGTDPFTTAVLVGFIVSLLGLIYREITSSRDKVIAKQDKRIEKLEAEVEKMAARSSSLATSAEKMLDYFLDRESSHRPEESASSSGRPPP